MRLMEKKVVLILIVSVLIIALIFMMPYLNRKLEISSYPEYYKKLAIECESKESYECCISSVRNMFNGNYTLALEGECPEGYLKNMLKCIDTYVWCESSNKNNELHLVSFDGTCKDTDYGLSTKITSKVIENNKLFVELITFANCCSILEGKINHTDEIINLIFIETGVPCDCLCTTLLNYTIEGENLEKYKFELNNVEIS
jgi:hypothetical protein